jgi:hypothetical protein
MSMDTSASNHRADTLGIRIAMDPSAALAEPDAITANEQIAAFQEHVAGMTPAKRHSRNSLCVGLRRPGMGEWKHRDGRATIYAEGRRAGAFEICERSANFATAGGTDAGRWCPRRTMNVTRFLSKAVVRVDTSASLDRVVERSNTGRNSRAAFETAASVAIAFPRIAHRGTSTRLATLDDVS